MRTSTSHPLQIAEIMPAPGHGLIGVTICPGKKQRSALTGAWDRDLDLDLEAIARWNAAAVVTLVEDHELAALRVTELGPKVAARGMAWHHLPIVDMSTPGPVFEAAWATVGGELRARLRRGENVLVHCKGGLGRAGTIAARLLLEFGWTAQSAIAAARGVRRGAIETRAQEDYVRSLTPANEAEPARSPAAAHDRALGALLGLAIGDAVGTTLEFTRRDSTPSLTDMVGGGPFHLQPGQWTDDTSMALALADSLLAHPDLDEADLMQRFVRWMDEGEYSVTGQCFDIGLTTRQALSRWKRTGNPIAGSFAPHTAGNGSLMRLAPVAIRHWPDRAKLRDVAARQSAVTHAAPEAVDACVAFAELIADAIAGQLRSAVLADREGPYAGAIAGIMRGSWRCKQRADIRSSGYVAHSLEAALWCVARTVSFEEAVLLAANLGDDADTTAAITGQLAGALYGASCIPAKWLDRLAWRERIAACSDALSDAS